MVLEKKIFFPVFLEPETLDLFFNLYHSLPPLLSQLVSKSHYFIKKYLQSLSKGGMYFSVKSPTYILDWVHLSEEMLFYIPWDLCYLSYLSDSDHRFPFHG